MAVAIESALLEPRETSIELSDHVVANLEIDRIYEWLTRAYQDLDAYAAAALYTRSALHLTPDRIHHRGRRTIRRWYLDRFGKARERGIQLSIHFVVTERGTQNGVIYDSGVYVLTGRASDEESPVRIRTGKFVAMFRRTSGASWNYRIDCFSTLLAPGKLFLREPLVSRE